MFKHVVEFIKTQFPNKDFVALHEPYLGGNVRKYINDCIDSTFVSSVGKYVDQFEKMTAEYSGAKSAVATMNGTAALHTALNLLNVNSECEVVTQALSFIATCNAISYTGAKPVFVDVELESLGMCPKSLEDYFKNHTELVNGVRKNKTTGRRVGAVVPMHTFGHSCKIDEIVQISNFYGVDVIEDAAESLGTFYKGKHTGLFGKIGIFSYNGNKTITTGGGGMVITNDIELGKKAKHITTTAKIPHPYEYRHDVVGYNYRLPNLNAALGCAQMESLPELLKSKKELTAEYRKFFNQINGIKFVDAPKDSDSNFWLNAVLLENKEQRDLFLKQTNELKVMTRPVWILMNRLDMYKESYCLPLTNSIWIEERLVNIPSSARLNA